MNTSDTRASLRVKQAELMRALVAGAPSPQGWNGARVELVARTLRDKRARTLADHWPGLARSLGSEFSSRFHMYAEGICAPTVGGVDADAMRFIGWLGRHGVEISPAIVNRRFRVLLQNRLASDGLRPRKLPAIKACVLDGPHGRRVLIGVVLPGVFCRILRVGR